MKNNKKINEVKKEMENLKKDFDKNYLSLEAKLKKLEKGSYEVGDEVKYCGLDWLVIGIEEKVMTTVTSESVYMGARQFVKLMLKNKLNKEQLKTCGYNPDSYNDIAYNQDSSNNDWLESDVRKCVIKFANEKLNVSDLQSMRTNYDENKYSEDFIRIPTLREAEALPKNLRKIDADSGYWTMTSSYGTTDTDSYAYVFRVNSDGNLGLFNVYNTNGVRPVITLSTENLN